VRDGIPHTEPIAGADGGRGALHELGLDKRTDPRQQIPIGAFHVAVQLLWASHGDVDEAAARARKAAETSPDRERYLLIAALLDRAAKDPSIANGALR